MRARWLAVGAFALAGCQTLVGPVPPELNQYVVPAAAVVPGPPARPPGVDTPGSPTTDDPLTRAAKCLEDGDHTAACGHLETYVRKHPDQIMFRAHLAELLFRHDHLDAAKAHFERFVADAQTATGPPRDHLVHCHTRLMEVGQRADDRFAELFHRGVGMVLLVNQNDADADVSEEVVCKAVKALTEAHYLRPTDPRVHLYLAEIHTRTGNRRAADVARAAAKNFATPGALTPAEQRRLALP